MIRKDLHEYEEDDLLNLRLNFHDEPEIQDLLDAIERDRKEQGCWCGGWVSDGGDEPPPQNTARAKRQAARAGRDRTSAF